MNLVLPFTKDVKFNSNIAEILSISLEHDYTINDRELLGNFTISGEYKTHEVSVNKESFQYVLPFSVSLSNNIDRKSIDFEIDDFTYEIIDNNTLRVNIEYKVNAIELKKEEKEIEPVIEIDTLERNNDQEEEKIDIEENSRDEETEIKEQESIIESAIDNNDKYVTYNIHIVKEQETIDLICSMYNTQVSVLESLNDLKDFKVGSKIIIPQIDE